MEESPDFLVFSGGGLHGLGYVGALIGLEERGSVNFERIKGAIGTSVGSMLALACCIGLSPSRMHEIVATVEWARLYTGVNIYSVLERYGLETRSGLEYLVQLMLIEAGICPTATLRAVHALTKRHFVCTVTDLTHSKLLYLDHLTAPDLEVLTAVTASMCVPVLFEPVSIGSSLCVDGGLIENLPVGFFPSDKSMTLHFATVDEPKAIDGWQEYVSAVLQAGTRAKEDRDVQALRETGSRMLAIAIPKHLPSGLDLKRINTRIATVLVSVGYLQTIPQGNVCKSAVGSLVSLACRYGVEAKKQ